MFAHIGSNSGDDTGAVARREMPRTAGIGFQPRIINNIVVARGNSGQCKGCSRTQPWNCQESTMSSLVAIFHVNIDRKKVIVLSLMDSSNVYAQVTPLVQRAQLLHLQLLLLLRSTHTHSKKDANELQAKHFDRAEDRKVSSKRFRRRVNTD